MTESDIKIRHATPDDLEQIVTYNQGLAIETEGRTIDDATLRNGIEQALADRRRCLYFVAERGPEVVGQCMVTFEWTDWRNGWLWWFQSVYVHKNHRRQGIFRALYDHVEREARSNPDVRGLRLYVERDNHTAMKTYDEMGMTPSGHIVYEHDWSDSLTKSPTHP